MAQKLIALSDGKAVNILDSDDPNVWNYFGGKTDATSNELYSRVAAAFSAVNKVSLAVANMPFAIMRGKDEIDNSSKWQNEVGFMPNPRDLLRRVRQSLVMSNRAYLRMGKNRAGISKQLHFLVQSSIQINTAPGTGQLISLDRMVGGQLEKSYKPDDYELIRFWWLDDTTELLPSDNTEFKAIMSAAGLLYYADFFTANFFRRGGVKPTLIAMKGLISKDKEGELQSAWTKFLNGIGSAAKNVTAKIFNAEAMDIKSFGDGLGDLKETPVFRRALEDIAIGLDMPLSLLLSNSANYATAQVEQRTFYRSNVVPHFDFIADALNDQLFTPLGLRMENRAETQDAEQQEEVSRSYAIREFNVFLNECASAELALEQAATFGYELTDGLVTAIQKFFADKKSNAEKVQGQQTKPAEIMTEELSEAEEPEPTKTIYLTLDNMEELRVWREVALRKWRKAESLDFDYQPHYGGLPPDVAASIKSALSKADSIEAIKAAFDIAPVVQAPEPVYRTDPNELEAIRLLVQGIGAGVKALQPNAAIPEIGATPELTPKENQ